MATIPSKMAVPPLPKMGEQRDAAPPGVVEVLEEWRPEGKVVVIRVRNNT